MDKFVEFPRFGRKAENKFEPNPSWSQLLDLHFAFNKVTESKQTCDLFTQAYAQTPPTKLVITFASNETQKQFHILSKINGNSPNLPI